MCTWTVFSYFGLVETAWMSASQKYMFWSVLVRAHLVPTKSVTQQIFCMSFFVLSKRSVKTSVFRPRAFLGDDSTENLRQMCDWIRNSALWERFCMFENGVVLIVVKANNLSG